MYYRVKPVAPQSVWLISRSPVPMHKKNGGPSRAAADRCRAETVGRFRSAPMSEQEIQQHIRLELSRGPVRLWRNNTGALRDERGRLVRYGLCPGSADLIGFRTVTVTPDMVGQQLAQFVALEIKAPTGRVTQEQRAFLTCVDRAGGVAGVARSVRDAADLLQHQTGTEPVSFPHDIQRTPPTGQG